MKLSISAKLVLAIVLAVAAVAGSASLVAVSSVDTLSRRLAALHTEAVLPLWRSQEARDQCADLTLWIHRVLTDESGHPSACQQLARARVRLSQSLARYDDEPMLASQPEMRALLSKYGALQSQLSREQHARYEKPCRGPWVDPRRALADEIAPARHRPLAGEQRGRR